MSQNQREFNRAIARSRDMMIQYRDNIVKCCHCSPGIVDICGSCQIYKEIRTFEQASKIPPVKILE